jgi:hypothetical protein
VDGTQTTSTPVLEGRKERQLIGGRYRLAAFHRSDATTEVWRALDEETQHVVTLEFLSDKDPGNRERFLAQGHRMARIQNPSVMRVSAISEDPNETYIVYEHLVHVPVALDALKPPEAAAPMAPAPVMPPAPPFEAVVPEPPTVAAVAAPEPPAAITVSEPVAPEPVERSSSEHGLDALLAALRAGELALIDLALIKESAREVVEVLRAAIVDMRFEDAFADLRASLGRVNPSAIGSAFGGAARRATAIRPHVRAPSAPRPHLVAPKAPKQPKMRMSRVESVKAAPAQREPKAPKAPKAPGTPNRFLGRVRIGRVLVRGLTLGILAALIANMPADFAASLLRVGTQVGGEVASQVTTVGGQVASQVGSAVGQTIAGATQPSLAKASFDLPPLSAYGAAFEAQGPYPKATANGTVEWVVALRNTGSVGWYRGIDGAQASLALSDGTSAAVQSTAFVGPGQVGWFVVHFKAPAQPGTYNISLLPRIDGRGQLNDLGIYATVTVAAAP